MTTNQVDDRLRADIEKTVEAGDIEALIGVEREFTTTTAKRIVRRAIDIVPFVAAIQSCGIGGTTQAVLSRRDQGGVYVVHAVHHRDNYKETYPRDDVEFAFAQLPDGGASTAKTLLRARLDKRDNSVQIHGVDELMFEDVQKVASVIADIDPRAVLSPSDNFFDDVSDAIAGMQVDRWKASYEAIVEGGARIALAEVARFLAEIDTSVPATVVEIEGLRVEIGTGGPRGERPRYSIETLTQDPPVMWAFELSRDEDGNKVMAHLHDFQTTYDVDGDELGGFFPLRRLDDPISAHVFLAVRRHVDSNRSILEVERPHAPSFS